MKTLKSRSFVANAADIEVLTRQYLAGVTAVEGSRGTYLTALIATTQVRVGATPRKRAGDPGQLTPSEIAADVQAMRAVHKEFFQVVKKTVRGEGFSGQEFDSKVKKFCSSASTFKAFIKGGGDLRALVAEKETKWSLRKVTKPVADKPAGLARLVGRYVRGAEKLAKACTPENIDATVKALEELQSRVKNIAAGLASRRATVTEKAARGRKPHKFPVSTFVPQHRPAASAHAAQ